MTSSKNGSEIDMTDNIFTVHTSTLECHLVCPSCIYTGVFIKSDKENKFTFCCPKCGTVLKETKREK